MSAAHEHDANAGERPNRMGSASLDIVRPEEVIASIWADVLELDAVEPDDDFFELGGDSLSAIQILTRIGRRFNFKLTEGELFTARTVRGLCELLQNAVHGGDSPTITPVAGPRHEFAATSAQRRLWFLDRFIANPEVYSVPFLIRMQGDVDAEALRLAFERVEERHEVLRIHLEERDGQPVQILGPVAPFALPFDDLRTLPESERRPHLTREVHTCAATPIALNSSRLYRAKLYRTGTDEFFLWLNIHHAITDGWSWGVLFRDLETHYEAIRAGQTATLAPLPIQYGDVAVWQQEWSRSNACREQIDYWKQTLQAPVATLDLPFSKPRPKMQTFRGGYYQFELPKKLLNAIDKLSRQASVTRFMIGLAAFQTVLHRYTGQDDLLIGSPVANRNRTEVEPLIGMFVNTLILRTNLGGEPTFRELLERVRQVRLGAFAHQDVPLETLLEELRPPRDTSRQPYFQTAFYYQNVTIVPERMGRHKLSVVPIHHGTSMFDLRLVLEDGAFGSVWGWIEFNSDLFDEFHIKRLVGHFLTVLEAACANPNQRLNELPLLTASERQQVLFDWNATAGDYPANDCLADAFTRQAIATPQAIALHTSTGVLTYGELNQQANQLAHFLQAQGLQAGDFVAVGLPRTPAMIVAVLAISKAGGAYVPLDVNYPKDRLAFMLSDTQARWLMTHSGLRDRFPASATPFICLDEMAHALTTFPTTNPDRRATPDTVAYVIYTSGSTGKPKGVVVRHRAAINTIDWVNREFGVQSTDQLLFVTSLSFDLSVYDIFGVLGAGGSLRIATESELRDPAQLVRIVRDEAITMWDSAPAALQQCVPFFGHEPCATLRLVMLSGDWIPVALPDQIRSTFPNAQVMSLGGATEAAIWSNWYPIGVVDPTWPSIPYGRPIRNARYHVLNAALQPQPVGVPGELLIGGTCLADGYLHRPELTAERFIADPFQPNAKLYRTGDLARYLPDGQLQFLGRIDQQVKVRGFRVEVGEIEAALSQHAQVQDAVVRPFRDDSGFVYLAAYIVPRGDVTAAALTSYLQASLPEYMIPSAFVVMDRLPVTPNGKVDRTALQPPARSVPVANADEAPQGPIETAIATVFADVLNLPVSGRNANFFELGGHSLKAAQLVARLQDTLGVEFKLGTLFDRPTIAGLARYAHEQQPNLPPPLQRDPALTTIAPMAPTQRRFWMVQRFAPESATYNVCDVIRIDGLIDPARFTAAVNALIERHETLRTVYRDTPELQQVIQPPAPIVVPIHDLTRLPDAERERERQRLITTEARVPFDLTTGPVCRFTLVKRSTDQHLLIFTIHHIAFDESSRESLLGDLFRLYDGQANNNTHAPRYLDFATWEQQRLIGAEGERLLAAWRERLANAPVPATYPALLSRPTKPTGAGHTQSFTLPASTIHRVGERAKEYGTTPFVVYTAAMQALLARVSGQEDICVLTPAQVRPARAKNIVGCFVNSLPLRTSLSGNPTFRELLDRVRSTVTHALSHAALPFDRIVEELRPARGPDGQPLAQTAIIHDHATLNGTSASLRWQLEHVEGVGAKFDLTLGLTDTPNCWIEYRTDLYTATDAARIAAEFSRLLATACTEPETPLYDLPILAEDEEQTLRHTWAGTIIPRPPVTNMIELLDQQANRTPHAAALIVGHETRTYAQLHSEANRLARYLQSLGVGPETLVGVCMERTAALPVALLAVLKAGGAYVPLDPAYPADRLAFMLDDAQARVLLTQRHLQRPWPNTVIVCVDDPQPVWATFPDEALPCPAQPHHPAYVIYTSGSTGKPKGVVLEHRSVIEFIHWGHESFTNDELRGVLFSTSICFDLSIFELFVTWSVGGSVILAPHALALPQLPARDQVTLLNTVPSAANELVRTRSLPPSVRVVNLAGEPLPVELAKQLYAVPTIERVCNLYGPTEDTTYSTWCVVPPRPTRMDIGRPLPNTFAYILDPRGAFVPIGVPGELHLGGAGLARGYHRRPELTASRFIVHEGLGQRLYRTGDLCRWRDDGTIEYLGRIDHQVKVRGFRIELGEIENALVREPGVKQAVVVATDDPVTGKRLIAYVAGTTIDTARLREQLKQSLPDYMVPGLFVVLPELPQTPNGKVDRQSLPAVDVLDAPRTFDAPTNDAERALQHIWQEVLRVAPISVTTPFEELGGHSLAAAAIMARVDGQLGHKLPLETLFKAPTIRQLAEVITQKLEVGGGVIVPLNEQGSHPPLFLIAGAGGHVFAFHKFSRMLGAEFPVYGMKAIGVEGDEPPLDRIEAIAARYLDEILRVRPTGPYVLGGYSVGGIVAFELALQMQRRGLEVARVIAFDTFAPGYPRKRAWPIRMAIHLKNFLSTGHSKWGYLSARYRNIRERLYRRIGLGHLVVPEPPGVGGLSAAVLRRVWAALDIARLNYWPAGVFDGRMVVMRSDKPRDWAATTLDDPHLGWNCWTTKPVQAFGLPAAHMELFGDANIELLVADIRDVLTQLPNTVRSPQRTAVAQE